MVRKPVCVTIVAAFLWMATGIALFLAVTLLHPGTPADEIWRLNPAAYQQFNAFGRAAGVFLFALGCTTAMVGAGLLRRQKWAWWLALGIFAVNGAGDIVGFIITRDLARSGSGVLVAACFLFCLMRRNVRSFYDGFV